MGVRLKGSRPSWELPGGKIDGNETPREAFIRELAEEANIRNVYAIQPLTDFDITIHGKPYHTHFLMASTWEPIEFIPSRELDKSMGWHWFTLENLPPMEHLFSEIPLVITQNWPTLMDYSIGIGKI